MMNYEENKLIIDLSNMSNIAELGVKITDVLESNNANNKSLYLKLGSIDLKQSQLLSIKALIEAMQSKLEGIETFSESTETSAIALGLSVGKTPTDTESFSDNVYSPQINKSFEEEFTSSQNELSSFAQLKQLNSLGDDVSDTKNLEEVETPNLQEETQQFLEEVEQEDNTVEQMTKEERVANIYDSLGKEMTHEDIQDALDITFGTSENSGISDSVSDIEPFEEDKIVPSEDIFSHVKKEEFGDIETTETVEKTDEDKYVLLDTEGITPEGLELIKSNTSDLETLYLSQTLRSGQTVSFEGNIFLIGDAHPGSEINATGDITVWGILGGIVHAGTKGNTDAKVRALKLNPIQLRIANLYSRRNDTVNVPYVQKSNEFTPEEARIENERIVIYKTLRRED